MLSAKEISTRNFEKAKLGGYKPDEVDQFLKEIALEVAQLQKDKEDADKKIDILADKVREYMKDEDALKDALLGAQRQGYKVIEDAQSNANNIIADANEKAAQIISHTQRLLEVEKINLANMQKEVSDFKAKLLSLYKNHLDLITAMPDVEVDEPVAAESAPPPEPSEEKSAAAEPKKQQFPFSPSNASAEPRYTDLKFGNNSK